MNIHSRVLKLVRGKGVVTTSEVAKELKVSWNTAEKYLLELIIDKKVRKIKKLGVNLWMLK